MPLKSDDDPKKVPASTTQALFNVQRQGHHVGVAADVRTPFRIDSSRIDILIPQRSTLQSNPSPNIFCSRPPSTVSVNANQARHYQCVVCPGVPPSPAVFATSQ
ncbi:hypothetical protein AB1N83_011691 [Pleurotus pulmonarius]